MSTDNKAFPRISWEENGVACHARWRSETGVLPPKRVLIADDTITADIACRLACEGTALLWRGDFQNARQLLQAMTRRLERKPRQKKPAKQEFPDKSAAEAFHQYRMARSQHARTLGMLLLPLNADYSIPLRRAPNVEEACSEVYGAGQESSVISLRELLGLIGAHEWRKKGVEIAELKDRIHPHYGVFSPVRGEYIALVAQAPLPSLELAFDIGTGTGVLAAVLARRGIKHVVATDRDARALACAKDNIARLNLSAQVAIIEADLFPSGRAPLIVCNPPWLPGRPGSPLECALYDEGSRMLLGFLRGLTEHLTVDGEGWLILSDLAEHLGLRSREMLLASIEDAGLKVLDRLETKPHHPRSQDASDPLHHARKAEITSLWRLAVQ